jgi:hypothetical protein
MDANTFGVPEFVPYHLPPPAAAGPAPSSPAMGHPFMSQLNIRGVNCSIAGDHDDNPGIVRRWTDYGPQATVRFMVDWEHAQNLAAALLGSVAPPTTRAACQRCVARPGETRRVSGR